MRHFLIRAGLLALAVILWGSVNSPAHAQRVPPGSYLQTCRDVQMRGWNNLEARCETARPGQFRFSQLNDVDRCRSDIANRNGQLWCERGGRPGPGPGPHPGPRPDPRPGTGNGPQGSYRQTCGQINQNRNILRATCRDQRGRWVDSRLDMRNCAPRSDIANRNGQLWCERGGRPGPGPGPHPGPGPGPRPGTGNGPQGSYRQSCGQINQVGNILRATCRDQRGRWVDSRLDILACAPRSDISNRNGQLFCPPIPPPPGPYRQTCRNIRVAGAWLAAECQNMNGRWREARLNLATCHPPLTIVNFNGTLVCR
ncbi:CVNH domain-containing protein [Xanthobacter sp. TB0139]|uniref:CVNH domain-containing protein n=1 Tax=Xanthobacter sp. TB0139 TaxID=3459178 RepID=UPI00403A75EF